MRFERHQFFFKSDLVSAETLQNFRFTSSLLTDLTEIARYNNFSDLCSRLDRPPEDLGDGIKKRSRHLVVSDNDQVQSVDCDERKVWLRRYLQSFPTSYKVKNSVALHKFAPNQNQFQ